jgi:hypothetical protein
VGWTASDWLTQQHDLPPTHPKQMTINITYWGVHSFQSLPNIFTLMEFIILINRINKNCLFICFNLRFECSKRCNRISIRVFATEFIRSPCLVLPAFALLVRLKLADFLCSYRQPCPVIWSFFAVPSHLKIPFMFGYRVHTVEHQLSGLIGKASHPDMHSFRIIGCFF